MFHVGNTLTLCYTICYALFCSTSEMKHSETVETMNKEINFILERYRSGGSNRYTCPQCGKRKCFTRYINVETGEYVGEECGICNHASSCGYHYPPREYYRDHPLVGRSLLSRNPLKTVLNANLRVGGSQMFALQMDAFTQTEFFPLEWAERAVGRESTFSRWFMQLPYDDERKRQVLAEYYVGATEKDIITGGQNRGKAAVFWMIDERMRVHDAKLIAYNPDGHRVQGWGHSMRSICEKSGKGPQLDQTEKVLFGLHLIDRYPEKTVYIVESEKSALICACHYPQHLWLATGGCGNLQASKLKPLMNRKIVVCPDSGEYRKWCERMKESGHRHYDVLDTFEAYEPNTDIADVILSVTGCKVIG